MLRNQSFNGDLEPSSSSVSSYLDMALLYHIYLLYYPKRKRKELRLQQGMGNTQKTLSTTISIPPTTYNTPPATTEWQRGLSCPPLSFLSAKSPKYCWKSQRYTDRKHDISLPNAAHKGGISPPSARHKGNVLLVSWHGLAPEGAEGWRKVQLRQGASGTHGQVGWWKCECSQT